VKLLLDEDVPEPLLPLLERLILEHEVQHVASVKWKSKKDIPLFADAKAKKFEVLLTNNLGQLQNPDECKALQRSGLHCIYYTLDPGRQGLAMACGAICAAIRPIMLELADAPSQRLVFIQALAKRKRYQTINPATSPPSKYWP
jgi:hypothetical protein